MKHAVGGFRSYPKRWNNKRYSSPGRVPVQPSQGFVKPVGLYTSQALPNDSEYSLDHPACNGALVRILWSDVEPSPGMFIWDVLDSYIFEATSRGKLYTLAVAGGTVGCPTWLTANATDKYTIAFRGPTYTIAAGWDEYYLTRLQILAQALANKYGADPMLKLVYVPQATGNGIEGHFNGNLDADLVSQGMTAAKWVKCSKDACHIFAQAFPTKAVAFEVHKILSTHEIPMQILNEIYAETNGQVGAGIWWLRGNMTEQSGLIDALYTFPGDKYVQPIGRSNQTERFPLPSDWLKILDQAKQINARYVEAWNYEFTNNTFPDEFTEFNAWALGI